MSSKQDSTRPVSVVVDLFPGLALFLASHEGQALTTDERKELVELGATTVRAKSKSGLDDEGCARLWCDMLQGIRSPLLAKTEIDQAAALHMSAMADLHGLMASLASGRCMRSAETAAEMFAEAREALRALRDHLDSFETHVAVMEANRPMRMASADALGRMLEAAP
jgi:hypothetical protein